MRFRVTSATVGSGWCWFQGDHVQAKLTGLALRGNTMPALSVMSTDHLGRVATIDLHCGGNHLLNGAPVLLLAEVPAALANFLYCLVFHLYLSTNSCSGVTSSGVSSPSLLLISRIWANLLALAKCRQFQVSR